ncbi:amidase signature domain-containing protein [Rhypophila decipiens]|uniref:Amidase signature domain-containing protein n=1 Tax=Rhypophila decipiens TaxID=261697 RepID=A0AAN6Y3L7_9PEZI|nr:amidase signature domain-containing protein [Rhypophila decipiens]
MDTLHEPTPSSVCPLGGQLQHAWERIAEQKRQSELAKIPGEWVLAPSVVAEAKNLPSLTDPPFIESLLDAETCRITTTDATELLQQMASGELTAVQVVISFCKRAAIVHQLTQSLLEIGFDIAIRRAKELDEYFATANQLVGPLHGLPFTLKDQFHVKGLETSMGYVGWVDTFEGQKGTNKERRFESELVREFNTLGAVVIGKYMGEGVMQALRGSVFGIGTDIGGSVSMPASYNGLFSLKPSNGRISMKGAAGPSPGQQIMPAVAGIMAVSIATIRLVLRSLLSTEPWLHDPYIVPIPWRETEEYHAESGDLDEPYRPAFGIMESDGVVTPHPPVQRALKAVKEALSRLGHKMVPWEPPSNQESEAIHGQIARGDGCADVWEVLQLSGEPEVYEIRGLFEPDGPRDPLPLLKYQEIVAHMKDYRNRYQEYWMSTAENSGNGKPVDAFISPVTVTAGLLPDKFCYGGYLSCVNVLDLPAVVVPVLFADKNIDKADENFQPLSHVDKTNMDAYDAEAYHGSPAAVLVVGRRLCEEKLLSLAQMVVDALHTGGPDSGC